MRLTGNPTPSTAALDYDSTLIGALELSSKKWMFAVQLPGVKKHSRHVVEPNGPALAELIERLKSRSAGAGRPITRVIITHEAGRDGFWLARFLARRGVEVHAMQSSSLPVDRRARRAKTDVIGCGANFRNRRSEALGNIIRLMRRERHSRFLARFCH